MTNENSFINDLLKKYNEITVWDKSEEGMITTAEIDKIIKENSCVLDGFVYSGYLLGFIRGYERAKKELS